MSETSPLRSGACCFRDGSRSSPDRVAASGASSRCVWRARAPRSSSTTSASASTAQGTDEDPAAQVCKEIEALGGEAVPELRLGHRLRRRRAASSQTAVDAFGKIDILVNNAGIVRDRTLLKMDEERLRRGRRRAPEGHVQLRAARGAAHEGRGLRPHHQHHVVGRAARQLRPDQLRRGQGRDHGHDVRLVDGARPVRHHRERDGARRARPA